MKRLCFFAMLSLFSFSLFAIDADVSINTQTVKKYQKIEISVKPYAVIPDGYDYDRVELKGYFTAPSSKKTVVEGFYCDEYNYNGQKTYVKKDDCFKLRFLPNDTGEWKFRTELFIDGKSVFKSSPGTFKVMQDADDRGFIKVSQADQLFLEFANKVSFYVKAINMPRIKNAEDFMDYSEIMEKFRLQGGNTVKLGMSPDSFGIEDKIKDYSGRQKQAFLLDQVFDYAADNDMYIILCLGGQGEFAPDQDGWDKNPYNKKNKGMIDSPAEFFTSQVAARAFRNRIRYAVARWGYSRNLLAWETFSEADRLENYDPIKVRPWQAEMLAFIKKADINKHLTTVSYSDPMADDAVWKLPQVDFTQTQFYNANDTGVSLYGLSRDKIEKFNKPQIVSGFGVKPGSETDKGNTEKDGIALHAGIWAGAFSLSFGWPMAWNCSDPADREDLYRIYKPLGDFISGISWARGNYYRIKNGRVYYDDSEGKKPGDVVLYPIDRFAKQVKNRFIITPDGNMVNGEYFGAYLFGRDRTALKNDPVMVLTNPVPSKLILDLGAVSGEGVLEIEVNDEKLLTATVSAAQGKDIKPSETISSTHSFAVDLHAGDNEVIIRNSGKGWIKVDSIKIKDFTDPVTAPVFVAGMMNEDSAYLWFRHREYGAENTKPGMVAGAFYDLDGLKPGRYVIESYDTYNGVFTGRTEKIIDKEPIKITIPEFDKDIAIRVKKYR